MEFIMIHELKEKNGKTIKENNLARTHTITVGTLVEIIPWDEECEYGGMRLYVTKHTRDCDGTPLYSLGPKGAESPHSCLHGFGEDSLKIV